MFACPSCRGVHVEAAGVKTLYGDRNPFLGNAVDGLPRARIERRCPNCRSGMTEFRARGVAIDGCAHCSGVWLDRGELELLQETATKKKEKIGFWGGLGELVGWILLGFG
jgi:Zn-finger nucleic acid-binding protein